MQDVREKVVAQFIFRQVVTVDAGHFTDHLIENFECIFDEGLVGGAGQAEAGGGLVTS